MALADGQLGFDEFVQWSTAKAAAQTTSIPVATVAKYETNGGARSNLTSHGP